jgi:type I restriction enzyme R subunit
MLANLRLQLEAQNDVAFSDDEFRRVVNHLEKGNVFDKAQSLRV